MLQNKKVIGIGLCALVALLIVGGGFILLGAHHGAKQFADGSASINAASSTAAQPANDSPAGSNLSVGNVGTAPTAANLGQLNTSQTGGSGSSGSGSSSASASGSSAPSMPDPSTFAQYDKYQNSPHALFGDVQAGSGATLGANQKAAVYYKGWLTNGTMFDESKAGSDGKLQPFVFTLGAHQVIPGWEEAIAGMKVGGTRLMIIPPAVGYGAQAQASIPANSVLVFEVQLLAVQ